MEKIIEMMECCQSLQKLLQNDQEHIKENKIQKIEENNKQKMELINALNRMINHIDSSESKIESHTLLSQFKLEIEKCNKFINTNQSIVLANLNKHKSIWDKLSSFGKDEMTYDEKGIIKK